MSSTARRRAGGSQARGDSGTAGDDACAGQGNDGGASAVRNTSAHGAAPTSPSHSAGDGEFVGDESLWLSQPLKALILVLICVVAFTIRLFAVVRWESVRMARSTSHRAHRTRRTARTAAHVVRFHGPTISADIVVYCRVALAVDALCGGVACRVDNGVADTRRGALCRQVIHEYDPYFNFRTTKFLSNEGFYAFLNWFDDRGW